METYRDGGEIPRGMHRAQVIHTASGRVLFVTWPYASEASAIDRARRWIRQEYEKVEQFDLFGEIGKDSNELTG